MTATFMNVTGIIAEYNPFHNGHLYHLRQTRSETDADFVIVLMSGDFVQRGEPAVLDKWSRTRMALSCGADLVLELPSFAASGSAEYFASGAISLLAASGIVNTLSFGSESGDLSSLLSLAAFFCEEPLAYRTYLREQLKGGTPFPKARQAAFSAYQKTHGLEEDHNLEHLLASPNNLLGIEYLKALHRIKSSIKPHTIVRSGSGYHDLSLQEHSFASASGIRAALANRQTALLSDQIPAPAFSVLETWRQKCTPIFLEDFSSLIHYRLLSFTDRSQLLSCYDLSEDLADRIFRIRSQYTNITDFTSLLKTRQITYTRASRALLHLFLNMQQVTADSFFHHSAGYLRILGFRKSAAPLLSALKRQTQLPLITKLADAKQLLSDQAFSVLQQDVFCSSVYHSAVAQKCPGHFYNEYRQSPILLP